MSLLHLPQSKSRRIAALFSLAIVVGAAGLATWRLLAPWLFPPNPIVATPQLALAELQGRSLYFNGLALPWLDRFRPDLLTPEDRDPSGPRRRAFVQAPQNPKLFRQLDRQYRFDTVLLLGDPSNYQRLLDHLLEPEPEKRDFRLVYLDHWTFVFKRGAPREWQPADGEIVRQKVSAARGGDRAIFLAQAAGKMLAVRHIEAAKKWLDEAAGLDGGSVDVLSGLAGYEIALGRWLPAETFADKALKRDGNSVPALAAKVVAMRATAHKIDAFKLSEKLNTLIPEDPVRLWQHAQLAHEAGRNEAEIKALTRLVELARSEGRPAAEYEFFLGEAHAHAAIDDADHARFAIQHLRSAVADPLLPVEKRKFAEERIGTIRERTGIK